VGAPRGQDRFDVVVVGGGTAGCVLAHRLSADPDVRVLLLEAGRPDAWWDLPVQLPIAMGVPVGSRFHDWRYVSRPEPGLGGRRVEHPRGRLLGGSGAINGMIYTRGHPADFDDWARLADAPGWDWAHLLPYFRRAEDCTQEPPGTTRGRGGPQHLERCTPDSPLERAVLAAAAQVGHAVRADVNGTEQEGFGPLDQAVHRGRRATAARAYLRRARPRPNLEVRCGVTVTRVVFAGTRAVGVAHRWGPGPERGVAAGEVVLAAGAFGSPTLLQRSGVGAGDHLRALGLPVVADLPGVGENLQDHLAVHLQHLCREPVSLAGLREKGRWPGIAAQALLLGRGPGTRNPMQISGFVRSTPAADRPDVMLTFAPLAMNSAEGSIPVGEHGYQLHVGVMRSEARGRVRITAADPAAAPEIRMNYLRGPGDRRRWVDAVRRGRELLAAPALARYDGGETLPGPDVTTDDDVLAWVTTHGRSGYHPVGSARMGRDAGAVVDPDTLRVHGLDGLRVVDASVMPVLTNANPYAPTLVIAEKGADVVLGRAAPAAEPRIPHPRPAGADAGTPVTVPAPR
jgi:choline dehydrogenase